jgi:cytochrome c biogenesis protein CcmG/thiol:disulfide interchange protein DsbE
MMKNILSQHWTIFSIVILLFGSGWIWLSRTPPGSTTSGNIPVPRQGFLAPDFSLQTPDGQILNLAEFRGRPILINLWASWCPPCKAEMPDLEQVYKDYQSEGFIILGVNATNQDDPGKAISFAKEYGLTFPILFDMDGKVSQLYQLQALPTSFFVDKNGVIQDVVIGGPMSAALLRIRVEQLLK